MPCSDVYKYGEGVPSKDMNSEYNNKEYIGEHPGFRTDYSQTMEPNRGPRTYPSVEIISGK